MMKMTFKPVLDAKRSLGVDGIIRLLQGRLSEQPEPISMPESSTSQLVVRATELIFHDAEGTLRSPRASAQTLLEQLGIIEECILGLYGRGLETQGDYYMSRYQKMLGTSPHFAQKLYGN